MVTIVNVQDPSSGYNLAINSSGQIGISNFPAVQTIVGTVNVAQFPAVQPVNGTVDISDRSLRQLGVVTVANGLIGTNAIPAYTIIQDGTTSSSKLKVNSDGSIVTSNPSVGTTGSAIPTSATLLGASDGTNLRQLLTESTSIFNLRTGIWQGANQVTVTGANALKVDASATTQPISGTITANIGTSGSLALDATVAKLNIAQATALGSNTGPLIQGSVTTSAPSYTTGNINPLSLTTAGALRTDSSATTQPISGTITANIGTTNGLALDSSVNGILLSQGSTTSGQKGPLLQAAVTTGSPSYTTAQTSPLSLTTAGALRVDASATTQPISASSLPLPTGAATSAKQPALGTAGSAASDVITVQGIASMTPLKVDGSGVTQPVSGTVTVAQATGSNLHAVLDSGSTTAVTQATASNLNAQVQGPAASGTTQSGNPIKVGGVFNTTQPTVTNGQAVDLQATARGALLIASGIDAIAVNASQSGTWTVQPGNTANTTPWLATINQGGNSATVTASNALKVDGSAVTQPVSGTITANIGTTNGLALDATVTKLNVTQSTALGSNTGPMIQGSVTTNAPSYTTGNINPLSLDTSGLLRISLKDTPANSNNLNINLAASAATVTISGTVTANAGTNLNTSALALDTSVNGILVAQGSTTSGEKGPLIQGAVTTSSPSYTTAQTSPLSLTTAGALRVDASATTQPVSGTVTANIGTTNGLALDSSVNGLLISQGSTTSGEKGPLIQGAVTTNAPGYTTAQTSPLSLDTSGLLRMSLKDTPSNTNNLNVALAASSATVTVTATNLQTNLNQIGGNAVVTGGTNGLLAIGGPVASGSANADNPVKIGGVFNTTQPTVTNGQIVDAQMTARGAQIVATGTDTFNVTVNAALPSGSNTIGAVTQASGPWTSNITQFGNNNVMTGTGASGVGIPRVTISNDSRIQLWDGTNGPTTIKAANTSPVLADMAQVVAISPNNTGLPVNIPAIVQKTNNVSSGSVASLAKAFASNNAQGNSIIVVCAVGNGTAPTISDTLSNTYTRAIQIANSTALNVAIFYAVNIAAGANTVTVTNGGTTASIAMEIYEVSGLITQVLAQPDQTASNTGNSGAASTAAMSALFPNEYAFAGVGIGTAAQTITVGSGWVNDSGQQNPTTPAGLYSFVSMSQFLGSLSAVTPLATFTSEPWAIAVATFKTVVLPIAGTVTVTNTNPNGQTTMVNSSPVVIASNQTALPIATYNGTTWDNYRGNLDSITLVASAAYTTTQTASDQTNYNARGVVVVLDMTNAGTGSVTLEIDGKDPVSGKYYAILTGAAVTTNSTNAYTVYPGTVVVANQSTAQPLPRTWRVKVSANNSNSCTYSVGCMLIV